jgi:hypothetical protein
MTALDRGRAQRWHDTDHGADRKPLRSTRWRTAVKEREPDWVSSCWCCCEQCDPDWKHPRPNPFWRLAHQQ